MVVERLRHVGGGKMIAERDEQIAVVRLHHAAADVQAVRDGAALAEDRGHRDQARGGGNSNAASNRIKRMPVSIGPASTMRDRGGFRQSVPDERAYATWPQDS